MAKFNVGDRVVAMKSKVDVTEGRTYEVVAYPVYGDREVYIRDDVGDRNAIYEEHLELAEDEPLDYVQKFEYVLSELEALRGRVEEINAPKDDPKPEFKAGDAVRFKTTYVDFEGEVAEDGEYGEVTHNVRHPVVTTGSGAEVLIDGDEVEVSDVIEHVEDSAYLNETETKDSKTIVVEYDPIEWADIKSGDVIICVGDVVDTRKGYAYPVTRIVNGQAEYPDSVGEYNYVNISEETSAFKPMRQRIIG